MFLPGCPPGWLTQDSLEAMKRIAFDFRRPDLTVLDIGSFLGRSTDTWFVPAEFYKLNPISDHWRMPKVMCIDTFEYQFIPQKARDYITNLGYKINWAGDMLQDFRKQCKNAKHVEAIKVRAFPYSYQIDPRLKFDIIFYDANILKKPMLDSLRAIRKHTIPYRTVICGPHYGTDYAPDVSEVVNEFCDEIRGRFENCGGAIWSIKTR